MWLKIFLFTTKKNGKGVGRWDLTARLVWILPAIWPMTNASCIWTPLGHSPQSLPLPSYPSECLTIWGPPGLVTLCYARLAMYHALCGNGVGKKSCLRHYSAGWNTGNVQICVLGRYGLRPGHRWQSAPSDSLHPSLLGFPFYEPLVAEQREATCFGSVLLSSATPSCFIWPSRMSSSSGFHPTNPCACSCSASLPLFPLPECQAELTAPGWELLNLPGLKT